MKQLPPLEDCRLIAEGYETDKLGHPYSDTYINGRRQYLVFLLWKEKVSQEVWRIHIDNEYKGKGARIPLMRCGRTDCINPEHCVPVTYKEPEGVIPYHEAHPESVQISVDRFRQMKLRKYQPQPEDDMSQIEDLYASMSELSDEELLAIIKGKRNEMIAKDAKRKSKGKARTKKVSRAEQAIGQIPQLTPEQKAELLRDFGG